MAVVPASPIQHVGDHLEVLDQDVRPLGRDGGETPEEFPCHRLVGVFASDRYDRAGRRRDVRRCVGRQLRETGGDFVVKIQFGLLEQRP